MIVQKNDETCEKFKPSKIVKSLESEVNLNSDEAEKIARSVQREIQKINGGEPITTSQIRVLVQDRLMKRGHRQKFKEYESIGIPVSEMENILGAPQTDNANATFNPESVVKYVSDSVFKDYALRHVIPTELAHPHLKGDYWIHDLNYFPTRLNCMSHDPRFFFKKGLMVDGTGTHTSYAAPAKNLFAVINWLGQIIGTAQCSFSGAQGVGTINTFLAPFIGNMKRKDVKQCIQSFIFNLCLSYVSRGGESVSYGEPLLIRDKEGYISIVEIGDFVENFSCEDYKALSLNRTSGKYEWKDIIGGIRHQTSSDLVKTILSDGRSVTTTTDHSLFNYDENGDIVEVNPLQGNKTILTAKEVPVDNLDTPISEDEAFLIGVSIGDGCLTDNNNNKNSAMQIFLNKNETETQKRIKEMVNSNAKWRVGKKESGCRLFGFPVYNKILKEIGRGSSNKKIPESLLVAKEDIILALLDGLICSDGSVNRNRIEFNTTSQTLSNQIQFLLLRLGLEYNIHQAKTKSNFERNHPVFTIQVSASSSQKLMVTEPKKRPQKAERISQQRHDYSIIKPALKRPKRLRNGKVWENRLQWHKSRKLKYSGLEVNSQYYPEIWEKVKNSLPMEIREEKIVKKEKYVYDISVEDNENFVLANGIVCHNTAFSNLNIELCGVPPFLMDKPAIGPGGKEYGTYSDFIEEAQLLAEIFIEVLMEGDGHGRFHIMPNTAFVMRNGVQNERYKELLYKSHELAAKFPTPYFINADVPGDGGHNLTWGPVGGNTEIFLRHPDGSLKIENIKDFSEKQGEGYGKFSVKGDIQTLSLDDNDNVIWAPIKNVFKNPKEKVFSYTFSGNASIVATPNHEVFSISGHRKAFSDAKNNIKGVNVFEFLEEVEVSNEGILYGLFLGDGTYKNDNAFGISFLKGEKIDYIKKVLEELNYEHTISDYWDPTDKKVYKNFYIKHSNPQLFNEEKKIDWKSISADNIGFLSGVFCGLMCSDGHIRFNKTSVSPEFASTNPEIIKLFKYCCFRLGFEFSSRWVEPSNNQRNRVKFCRVYLSCNKQSIDLLKQMNLREPWSDLIQGCKNNYREIPNIKKTSIKKAEELGEEETFCLEVNGRMIVGSDMILVSNCRSTLGSNWTGDPEIDTIRCGNTSFITLNIPRYAHLGKDEDGLLDILGENMRKAREIMALRVDLFKKNAENGLFKFLTQKDEDGEPYYKVENGTHAFGIIGFEEALLNLGVEDGLISKEGQKISENILNYMNNQKNEWRDEFDTRYSLIASPAESASGKLCALDLKHYNVKNYKGTKAVPYYTNSHHLAYDRGINLIEKIKIESKFHKMIGGGAISHNWLGERPNAECLIDLSNIHKKNDARYWTYTNDYTICTNCNNSYNGLSPICINCGSNKTISYSKITGYIQKIENWNEAKKKELNDRHRHKM